MTERFIINGFLMEQGEGKSCSLVFQSPYFTDIDSIVSNRTYSVDFPRTPRNMRAVNLAGLPQGTSGFEFNQHRAIYIRDGVQIFVGKATLLSITPQVLRFSFTWGNIEVFQQLLDTNLADLQTDADYIPYGNSGLSDSHYIDGWNTAAAWGGGESVQPMLPVSEIIERISSRFGISLNFPKGVNTLDRYYLPLTSRNADAKAAIQQGVVFGGTSVYVEQGTAQREGDRAYLSGVTSNLSGKYYGATAMIDISGQSRLGVRIPAGFKVACTVEDVVGLAFIVSIGRTTRNLLDNVPHTITTSDGQYIYTVTQDYEQIFDISEVRATEEGLRVGYLNGNISLDASQFTVTNPSSIIVWNPDNDVVRYGDGAIYPLYANLPDWSISELIKYLMQLSGLFAYSTGNDITFVDIDKLYDNRRTALDWSKKLINSHDLPTESIAKFGDYAQRNWFRYAEDETVEGNYDGCLVVESKLLPKEADIVEVGFAATSGNVIPVWSKNDSGEYEWQDIEPRILQMGENGVSFSGMSWSNILSQDYATYQSIIRRPRVIKTSVRLSTIEVAHFDPTIPIYAAQFGHYYAVTKLTTKDKGKADIELLQLGEATKF